MQTKHWQLRVVCAVSMLALTSGCRTYYPYGYGNPGYYSAPPGGTVAPGGAYPGPGFNQPGGPALGPQNGGNWQQPTPAPGGGNAPLFNGAPNGNSTQPVPDPYGAQDDPNATPYDDGQMDDDFLSPFNGGSAVNDSTGNSGTRRAASIAADPGGAEDDEFLPPVPIDPVSASQAFGDEDGTVVGHGPNPYDYDRDNYSWLRGVVDFDENEQSWHIIYNLTPDDEDPFGGAITLVDDHILRSLRDRDVVVLEGEIDERSSDRYGKPQFRVHQMARLEPR